MSLDDQETEDILTRTGRHLRLRPYRKDDRQSVRDLYMYCMGTGPGAPREAAFKAKLNTWPVYTAYGTFTVGLALYLRPSLQNTLATVFQSTIDLFLPPPGQYFLGIPQMMSILHTLFQPLVRPYPWLLSAVSAGSVVLLLACINFAFVGYVRRALRTDLRDVEVWYRAPRALARGGQFWVVEDVDKSNVVGCVGLDTTGPTAELRRLCIHPSYRRLGLAQRLVDVLLSHTIKHNILCNGSNEKQKSHKVKQQNTSPKLKIREIDVRTLTCFPDAMRLYESRGWETVSDESKGKGSFWMVIWEVRMRRVMDESVGV